jgi:Cft2 family RNA processing exonuclease
MHLEFHGAAGEVTGSLHRLHVGGVDIALDCGLFQGHRADANRNNREVPSWALSAHSLVLSHAHLDHSGNIPTLVRRGFRGNIFCTPATRDLCSVMLRDAAMLQDQDARYINEHNQRAGSPERVSPLYGVEDAEQAVSQMICVPLHRPFPVAPSVSVTFHDAGHARGGRVYIPTFALERAQEVLFSLERLHERARIPPVPIYIDSPLAIAITEIYKLHPEGLSPDVRQRIRDRDDPFSPPGVHYVAQIADSRRLQASAEPCIIIAGSGMCEGGRILHHFTRALAREKNSVVIVGFMAQHTLGRRLLEGRARVRVFGVERDVRASVHALAGLSAHAGQSDLVAFAKATARAGELAQVLLVHGEPAAQVTLSARLAERLPVPVLRPVKGQIVPL